MSRSTVSEGFTDHAASNTAPRFSVAPCRNASAEAAPPVGSPPLNTTAIPRPHRSAAKPERPKLLVAPPAPASSANAGRPYAFAKHDGRGSAGAEAGVQNADGVKVLVAQATGHPTYIGASATMGAIDSGERNPHFIDVQQAMSEGTTELGCSFSPDGNWRCAIGMGYNIAGVGIEVGDALGGGIRLGAELGVGPPIPSASYSLEGRDRDHDGVREVRARFCGGGKKVGGCYSVESERSADVMVAVASPAAFLPATVYIAGRFMSWW